MKIDRLKMGTDTFDGLGGGRILRAAPAKPESYIPYQAEVVDIDVESSNTYLLSLRPMDEEDDHVPINYSPGQFLMVSVFGLGECPISIASSPTRDPLQICVREAGRITQGIMAARIGDVLGIRGPFGNGFPLGSMRGENVLIAGGGSGFATLRSLINYIADDREKFKEVTVVYGARTPQDLYFTTEYGSWQAAEIEVGITVDMIDATWKGDVGLVTSLLADLDPAPGASALCGPPMMIRAVAKDLLGRGFLKQDIHISLERHMKCGVGKCEHCTMGRYHVCTDGPIFSYDVVEDLI
ncbi:FAD/NAD(P)-binding protein [Candidatus Methanocrinis natronophilus]|uniref:FAD/NAD(P)-binding protein n=1 Tax=Candidatus Methanocrinis natronophilus TaxID=3033396 RepID=A0ABT5X5P6_9EURY|nr:FAD/NAD(P)-binding protein [Candidatus Methanocrinis natronophilus]MDF0590017.1 FAD/NAD(P)-binding protein [Candidatus Methanocrinis natronophilus]